jgi:hypothetical protein
MGKWLVDSPTELLIPQSIIPEPLILESIISEPKIRLNLNFRTYNGLGLEGPKLLTHVPESSHC